MSTGDMLEQVLREPYPFEQSLYIWGAHWWGRIGERTAALVENSPVQPWPMWDNTKADLDSEILLSPDGVSRPPDSWALPWVTQYRMRMEVHRSPAGQDSGNLPEKD